MRAIFHQLPMPNSQFLPPFVGLSDRLEGGGWELKLGGVVYRVDDDVPGAARRHERVDAARTIGNGRPVERRPAAARKAADPQHEPLSIAVSALSCLSIPTASPRKRSNIVVASSRRNVAPEGPFGP